VSTGHLLVDKNHPFNHLPETGLITRYVARPSWRVGADVILSLVVVFIMSFVRDPFPDVQCWTDCERAVPSHEAEL